MPDNTRINKRSFIQEAAAMLSICLCIFKYVVDTLRIFVLSQISQCVVLSEIYINVTHWRDANKNADKNGDVHL